MFARAPLIIGVIGTIALAGCSSSEDIVKQITAVQQATVKACSYLPTASVIAAIFIKKQDQLQSVEQVAAAICSVAGGKTALLTQPASVAGVPLEGIYVEEKK